MHKNQLAINKLYFITLALAQVDQAGGGNADDKARPSAPVSANTPLDQQGLADQARSELHKNQLAINKLYFITQAEAQHAVDKQNQIRKKQADSQQPAEREQREAETAPGTRYWFHSGLKNVRLTYGWSSNFFIPL